VEPKVARKAALWAGGVLLALLLGVAVALPLAIERYVDDGLGRLPVYRGEVDHVDVALSKGVVTLHRVQIERREAARLPLAAIPTLEVRVHWGDLVRGALVGDLSLIRPVIDVVADPPERGGQWGSEPEFLEAVATMSPMRFDRIQVTDGELHVRSFDSEPRYDLRVHDIALDARGLQQVARPDEPLPGRATLTATPTSGRLDAEATYAALADAPTFELEGKVTGVELRPLNPFLVAVGGVDVTAGHFSLFTELAAREGRVHGYLKPLFSGVEVPAGDDAEERRGALAALWAGMVRALTKGLESEPHERIASRIPLEGRIDDPKVGAWRALASLLQNAFVTELPPRFESAKPRSD
jgi:hypothetical protein